MGLTRCIRWPCLLMLLSFAGCGVKTGADAMTLDGKVLMCRTAEAKDMSWFLCRTHPTVTPDVLREAEELSVREGVSLPVAIGRLTGWGITGLGPPTRRSHQGTE